MELFNVKLDNGTLKSVVADSISEAINYAEEQSEYRLEVLSAEKVNSIVIVDPRCIEGKTAD